jgi:phenylalanyl-tRNA synthetase beta subunit
MNFQELKAYVLTLRNDFEAAFSGLSPKLVALANLITTKTEAVKNSLENSKLDVTARAADSARLDGLTLAEISQLILASVQTSLPSLVDVAIAGNAVIADMVTVFGTAFKQNFETALTTGQTVEASALLMSLAAAENYLLTPGQYRIDFDETAGTMTRTVTDTNNVTTVVSYEIKEGNAYLLKYDGVSITDIDPIEIDTDLAIADATSDSGTIAPLDMVAAFNAGIPVGSEYDFLRL